MTSFLASIRCGVLRRCVPTCTTRLCLRAAASIAWPSATSMLIGFLLMQKVEPVKLQEE